MDFLIQNAWAEGAATPAGSGFASLIPLVILFVVFYFLLIRPQTKRVKEHKTMVDSLAKGDEIVTQGGLLGKVTNLGDNFIAVEIAPNLEVKIQRQSVAAVMPKGTIKTL
ncbi:preprotein translocase subunit YajC [Beggiatoa leptomitoformis]|uniref:Sec translocon accessory complex subunit YajC n=1 Tax=Beggiatoa leptomitoformis TaxID=288004 RepID=A0A2N9YH98_9GAMM|nr:preprotein translocase subunit YajC [Beggiatoa leptomitoformis]ALG68107.1 preprotein translocase subunit YajC [Beggiatoa leptomitoformis]AUI69596.1 preprotein translocase subunit YajC [Beggiatoa leptomitoformis]